MEAKSPFISFFLSFFLSFSLSLSLSFFLSLSLTFSLFFAFIRRGCPFHEQNSFCQGCCRPHQTRYDTPSNIFLLFSIRWTWSIRVLHQLLCLLNLLCLSHYGVLSCIIWFLPWNFAICSLLSCSSYYVVRHAWKTYASAARSTRSDSHRICTPPLLLPSIFICSLIGSHHVAVPCFSDSGNARPSPLLSCWQHSLTLRDVTQHVVCQVDALSCLLWCSSR